MATAFQSVPVKQPRVSTAVKWRDQTIVSLLETIQRERDLKEAESALMERTVRRLRGNATKAPFKLKFFDSAIREKIAADEADLERLRASTRRWEAVEQEERERAAAAGRG